MSLIVLPAVIILCFCFFLFGWLMNQLGKVVIRRQVAEAAVWERAGMNTEAEAAFEQAKSIYDSFWLSPVQRRQFAKWITQRLARFYLVQPAADQDGQAMVMSYLIMQPQDHAVALGWLEAALHREHHTREEHDLAGRIAEALAQNYDIQKLLMQFFLSDGRVDFVAMQTYRQVWSEDLPQSLVQVLAKVLLNEFYIDDWALQVYLKAYALGDPECIEGIAAGVHLLRPNEDNRQFLANAETIVAKLDESRQIELARQFQPIKVENNQHPKTKPRTTFTAMGKSVVSFWQTIGQNIRLMPKRVETQVKRVSILLQQSPKVRNAIIFAVLFCMGSALVITGWHIFRLQTPAPQTSATTVVPTPTPISDPFTIQVAAYLSPEDAQRFVDRLNSQGVDAFFTKANSLDRTWYQVKVSHFATKEEAGKFGEMLKSKGLIDDFYVANYKGH